MSPRRSAPTPRLLRSGKARAALSWSLVSPCCSSWSDGLPSIFCCFFREALLAETQNSLLQPLPDGIVPATEVARTERRWLFLMLGLLILFMAVVVGSTITSAIHPPSNVETIDPTTLHLKGEFAESNLGTAQERDGSLTARLIADQYAFVPYCVQLAVDTPVKFRLTSTDVIHGFLLPATNVNTMVVPGYVAEVRTRFSRPGVYSMPCNEFCGNGHHGMWARVSVVPKEQFPALAATERSSCVQQ
jgi:cytochrome c oxidase subunit 2